MIADLDAVTESVLMYPAAGGGRGPNLPAAFIRETTIREQSLLEATRALAIGRRQDACLPLFRGQSSHFTPTVSEGLAR